MARAFRSSWAVVSWYGTACSTVADSARKRKAEPTDARATSATSVLNFEWLRDGTFNESQSKTLRYALEQLTGQSYATDGEWVQWYDSVGSASYPEPDFDKWYADMKAIHGLPKPPSRMVARCFKKFAVCSNFTFADALHTAPKNLGGWWSDGVIHLEISEPERDRFTLLGVTWIDSLGIAPFEIDLELDPNDDTYFAKTVFRLGMLDDYGRPAVCNRNLAPTRVLEIRPRYNRDWAMAVELTPRATNATDQSDPPKSPVGRAFES